jgi:hypothetical protein
MLSAKHRELLTAAIDGELTSAEVKAVKSLLRESEEARVLFGAMKRDSGQIRLLPRIPAPADLADTVLGVIRERGIGPTPLPPIVQTRRRPKPKRWLPFATAASVLLVIACGSYLYFASTAKVPGKANTSVASRTASEVRPVDHVPTSRNARGDDRPVDAVALQPQPEIPEVGPEPRELDQPVLTKAPDLEMPEIQPFHLDKIRISRFFTLRDLPTTESERAKLFDELKKDELIRLDLFTAAMPKATDAVLNALKSRGIEVHVDAFSQDRRRKNTTKELVIFTEAFSPNDVGQLLLSLGAEDKNVAAPMFDTLVVAPFLPMDLTQLTRLIGMPVVTVKEPKGKIDITKPLPEGTAQQVAAALTKMGGGAAPPATRTNNIAVMVSYSPVNPNPGGSKEIKQFLDRRGDKKPDAKPLMLVLRSK